MMVWWMRSRRASMNRPAVSTSPLPVERATEAPGLLPGSGLPPSAVSSRR